EMELRDVEAVREALRALRVRGAPAIGIAAAYGVCLGLQGIGGDERDFWRRLKEVTARLATSRPTAVNLFWALERLQAVAQRHRGEGAVALRAALLSDARALHEEDHHICQALGRHGAPLLADGSGVLTHCNAGGLATAGSGTALAILFAAQEAGKHLQVYVDETRPLLQGARLTVWELQQRGMDVTLICDSVAAQVMREGRVQAVVTGADRIAANGDVANKIGTYTLALAAAAHDIPFYVAAPTSTFDLSLASGDQIPIEQRDPAEVTHGLGRPIAPGGTAVYNPAFDVTPARLIRAIVCEKGVIQPVSQASIARVLKRSSHPS
ncbi:MAG: S-methyl-5-thioribose-1-phosphate isomerase, partial [Planctomycetales bacterium]|nr:S-methyl-5-thioribose-1-phosphate isomerase [Planctomycetales bacterium]